MYIAALTHDINHGKLSFYLEGYNNAFYVKLKSEWASVSEGKAVL